jgi:hypothetical protein
MIYAMAKRADRVTSRETPGDVAQLPRVGDSNAGDATQERAGKPASCDLSRALQERASHRSHSRY